MASFIASSPSFPNVNNVPNPKTGIWYPLFSWTVGADLPLLNATSDCLKKEEFFIGGYYSRLEAMTIYNEISYQNRYHCTYGPHFSIKFFKKNI